MSKELGRSDVAVARIEADAQAAQRVSCGDVPADVLGVGVVPVRVGVERAADLLNVVVADEQVARARAEIEAEPSATLVASGVRQSVEVVDVQSDPATGGGVLCGGGPVAGAGGAAQEGGGPVAVEGSRRAAVSRRLAKSSESRSGSGRCTSSIRMLSGTEPSARCCSASAAVIDFQFSSGTIAPSS
ncbi:hypothetical protein F3K40_31465 [Streptomyces sp. LBUM 1478]|nr:hypothetical protein [Streptomyces sp. LBUM 1478]